MVLVTRASSISTKRVRRAPSRPDFEMEELPRTAVRKKPRPKVPREKRKKAAPSRVVVIGDKEELDAVMRGLASDFDAATHPETETNLLGAADLLDPEERLLMPQFDPEFGPRATGPWTPAEDAVLRSIVTEAGAGNWSIVARHLPGRIGKQCRERWHNHLDPHICKLAWTEEEDMIIQMGVAEIGHKWSEIAMRLPGRTDNAVKNRYNARIKKLGGGATILKEAQRISDEDFMHELVRRNVLAEEKMTPGRFSPNQIEALAAGSTAIVDTPGCRWSNEEHSRLANAIPNDVLVTDIDWVKVSRVVPTRSALSCRRHWAVYLRGGWRPTAYMGMAPEPEPEPEPDPEPEPTLNVDVDAVFKTLETHDSLLTQYADDPNLEFMAIETYSEGSSDVTWSRSSVLVVGKPGLSFRFHTPGTEAPPPSPPPVIVRAEKVVVPGSEEPKAKPLETKALSDWMKAKEMAAMHSYQAEKTKRLQKEAEMREEMACKVLQEKKSGKGKKNMGEKEKTTSQRKTSNTVNTYFHTVKQQHDQFGAKAHCLHGIEFASAALAAVAARA